MTYQTIKTSSNLLNRYEPRERLSQEALPRGGGGKTHLGLLPSAGDATVPLRLRRP